jgi:hypothetical protein
MYVRHSHKPQRDRRTTDKNGLQDVPGFIIHRISLCVSYLN